MHPESRLDLCRAAPTYRVLLRALGVLEGDLVVLLGDGVPQGQSSSSGLRTRRRRSRLLAENFKVATPIQAAAMMPIHRGEHAVLHAETGSGKTLAYLLPLLSRCHASKPSQVLVVVPSRELAVQIGAVVERFGGREQYLIPVLMVLFALGGSTYGMAEETLAFYALLIPVMMAAGYEARVAEVASYHSLKEAKEAGYTCAEAKAAGYTPYECAQAGYTYQEGRQAGYSWSQDWPSAATPQPDW